MGCVKGRESPEGNGTERKGLWHGAGLVLAPTLQLACWVTLDESLALSEHVFPHLLKRVRECHCILLKLVRQSYNLKLVLSLAPPPCPGLAHM